jgi:hypothetical protein
MTVSATKPQDAQDDRVKELAQSYRDLEYKIGELHGIRALLNTITDDCFFDRGTELQKAVREKMPELNEFVVFVLSKEQDDGFSYLTEHLSSLCNSFTISTMPLLMKGVRPSARRDAYEAHSSHLCRQRALMAGSAAIV